MIGFKYKVRSAFRAVKQDVAQIRRQLFDNVIALSGEHAKLLARVQELERQVELLQGKEADERFNTYSASAQY